MEVGGGQWVAKPLSYPGYSILTDLIITLTRSSEVTHKILELASNTYNYAVDT